MKKTLLLISLVAGSFFSATADVIISDILGSYKGNLEVFMKAPGEDYESISKKDEVEVFTIAENDNSFTFLLNDFELMVAGEPMNVGDIKVPEVEIDNAGTITKGHVDLDKTEYGLGILPTTINGLLQKNSADLDIMVLWDFMNNYPQDGSPSTMNINVKFIGERAIISSLETKAKEDILISNVGNSIEFIGANLQSYSLYNIQGKLISNSTYCNNNTVEFSAFNNGIYIIKANTDKGTIVKKIVKK